MTSLCRVNNYTSYDVIPQVKISQKEPSSDCEASVSPENHDEAVSQMEVDVIEGDLKEMSTCCELLTKNKYSGNTENACESKANEKKIKTATSSAYRFSIDKILGNPPNGKMSGNQPSLKAASTTLQQPLKAARKWQINNNEEVKSGKIDNKSHKMLGNVNILNQSSCDSIHLKKKISTDYCTEQRTQQLNLAKLEYFRQTLHSEKYNDYESLPHISECKKLAVEESKRIAASVLCNYYGMQMNNHNQVKTWQDIFLRKNPNVSTITQENINGAQNNNIGNLGINLPLKVDCSTKTKRNIELIEKNNHKYPNDEILKMKSISNGSPVLQSALKLNSDLHKEEKKNLNKCIKSDVNLEKNEGMLFYVS